MSEQEQQKNRVLYNVQDLYFGLVSGEQNTPLVTGANLEEIEVIKRIHRVQGVTYDFSTVRQDIGVLGKASFDDNIITHPPDISLNITHSLEGLNNEKKMGFNVLEIDSAADNKLEFTRDFIHPGARQQNVYLAVNQDQSDIREEIRDPDEIEDFVDAGEWEKLRHSNSDKMGLVVFQNCYLNNYSMSISVGSLPTADTSWTADNAIYLNSALDQYVPWLNTKTATVYNKKNNLNTDAKFIIPRNYKRENPNFNPDYTFKPSDAQVTITTRPAVSDTLFSYDFEDNVALPAHGNAVSVVSTQAYIGIRSLKVTTSAGSIPAQNYSSTTAGGIHIDVPESQMAVDKYYTIEAYVKTDATNPITVYFTFHNGDSNGTASNLSTFKIIKFQDGWAQVKKRVKLDKLKNKLFIWTNTKNRNFFIDNVKLYKDAENPPLRFHTDLLQSFNLSVPLNRENIACVGYKYYPERAVTLPVKTTFSIAMSSQDGEFPISTSLGEDVKGDFLDNLRKDEEYDVYLTFLDADLNEGMKYRIFGARFESVNYGADIDSNKTSTLNFSMSNDYDYDRSVIAAEGKGLFVLNILVNDSLIPLTDDQGNYFVDPVPYNF